MIIEIDWLANRFKDCKLFLRPNEMVFGLFEKDWIVDDDSYLILENTHTLLLSDQHI